MGSNVIELHRKPSAVAHVLSVGHTHHKNLEELVAKQAFPYKRVLVDASHLRSQHELVHSLKAAKVQIVLDTKSIELSMPGGLSKASNALPWARNDQRQWTPLALSQNLNSYCRAIAEFAVASGVDVVLAPCHYICDVDESWLEIDPRACTLLRKELDALGGSSIAIDYHLTGQLTHLAKQQTKLKLNSILSDMPVQNVWLRASGFGHDASCASIRKAVDLCMFFKGSGKPIILDRVSGVTAMLMASTAAVGGISHGIANNREKFNSYSLRQPPSVPGGGPKKWIYISSLDLHIDAKSYMQLLSIKGTKSRIRCVDECCSSGRHNTADSYLRHSLVQRARQIQSLNDTQEANRLNGFVSNIISTVGKNCRQLAPLARKGNFDLTAKKLEKHSKRMDDLIELGNVLINQYGRSKAIQVPTFNISHIMPEVSGYRL